MQRDVLEFSSNDERTCLLSCNRLPDRRHIVSIDGFEQETEAVDVGAFSALEHVRRRLESLGWLISSQGFRPNAYASGLQRDMHGGIRAYICEMGKWPRRENLVDIFAAAGRNEVDTAQKQQERYRNWRQSLPGEDEISQT
jgi:hypothetical protein